MKQLLFFIVIFALLVNSPVSFSAENICNFYILITLNTPIRESKKAGIVVAHRIAKIKEFLVAAVPAKKCFFPFSTPLSSINTCKIEHGRAPPLYNSA